MRAGAFDIVIIGASLGGCSAALAACRMGKRVCLTEETDWVGGQLTTQAVPPDEHHWIESEGSTASYRKLRVEIREAFYRRYRIRPEFRTANFDPGEAVVSKLSHDPQVALMALQVLLAPALKEGLLEIRYQRKPVGAETNGDRVTSVTVENLATRQQETLTAPYFLDGTECGELLPLAGVEYVRGSEAPDDTREPHAKPGGARPGNEQAATWCFAMSHDPNQEHVIEQPRDYLRWRNYVPQTQPSWTGTLFDWAHPHHISHAPRARTLFPVAGAPPSDALWIYRRIISGSHFEPEAEIAEATLVNWPQNDYLEGGFLDQTPEQLERHFEGARQVSLSWFYWMQTEAPRPDGGAGYPGLYLRPDLTGTSDGLAKMPYIRESRRIQSKFRITENHVGQEAREFRLPDTLADSVGTGYYRIDLHPTVEGDNYLDIACYPFQIPLGALLPVRVENLLPACKNIGTTHITNGCYRLHPVEWNIGEAAGLLAAFSLERDCPPSAIREQPDLLREFQDLLAEQGIKLVWPTFVFEAWK